MATTVRQDSFTEAGTGTANLNTHTAEVGGTWTQRQQTMWIDKDADVARADNSGNYGLYTLGDAITGEVDVYGTNKAGGTGVLDGWLLARFISTDTSRMTAAMQGVSTFTCSPSFCRNTRPYPTSSWK